MLPDHPIEPLPAARQLDLPAQLRRLGLAAAALLALWLLVALFRHAAAAPEPAVPPASPDAFRPTPAQRAGLRIQPVRSGDEAAAVQVSGTISVDENRSVPVTLPFSGQVTQVLVQAGDRVRRGQPLLRVESADRLDAGNALTAARTQARTAAAQLRVAADNAQRQEAIYRTAGGALKDYRQAAADLVAARSAADAAASAARAAAAKVALYGGSGGGRIATFAAPVAGVVVSRSVTPGQYVGVGGDKPLMTVADLSHIWLVAQLPEGEAAGVRVGDAVTVTTPAYPGRRFDARIDNVAATLDPVTHRLAVRATVANPDGALKPEMFASFAIRRAGGARAGVLVPTAAVIHEGDTARVWVATADGLLHARRVIVADTADGWDRVTAGLAPGERIVTAGALFVNEAGLGA